MRFRFFVVVVLISAGVLAQKDKLKIIDSINQAHWRRVQPNLDSLANPVIEHIPAVKFDTVVVRDEIIFPNLAEPVPVTPYLLNNEKEPKKWYFFGQNNLVVNQASFSNWNSGGNDNFGMLAKINYNLSYRNGKHYQENILQLGYGWLASKGQSNRKTEDYINFLANYGYDLGQNFFLSTGFQFLSQFQPGYNYGATPDPEFADRISRFMAPGYLSAGIGMSYNPTENFQVIFRPASGKFTFVTDPHLQKAGRYGLERDGQDVRTELGAMLNIIYRLKIFKDITLDNQLNFFSNYLTHSERVDVAYSGVLNIRFNKFINTIVSLDLAYDHDQVRRLQRKQTLGIGFSYNLGQQISDKDFRKKLLRPIPVK